MTPPRTRALLLGAATALVAGACAGDNSVAVRRVPTAVDSADQVMFGARSLITKDGVVKAELFADTALFFDDNTRIEMRGVKTHFHTQTGERSTVLTSNAGTYNTRLNSMSARGNVIVIAKDGRVLNTPQLRYDQMRNLISGDSDFTLTQPGGRKLEGTGFISDPNMTSVQVLKAARGSAGVVSEKSPEPADGALRAPDSARPAAPVRRPPGGTFTLPRSKP